MKMSAKMKIRNSLTGMLKGKMGLKMPKMPHMKRMAMHDSHAGGLSKKGY